MEPNNGRVYCFEGFYKEKQHKDVKTSKNGRFVTPSFNIPDLKTRIRGPADVNMVSNMSREAPKTIFNHPGHISDLNKRYMG